MTMSPARDPEVQALLDKQAIQEVLVRYLRGADRADAELIRRCYHPDATEDHGGTYRGTASDYVDMIAPNIGKAKVLTHAISNILIELESESLAYSECYITTFGRCKKDGELFDTLTLARAFDRFEKRNGEWRIAARRMCWEWNHEMPVTENWGRGLIAPDPSVLIRGAKRPLDIIYQR